MQPMPVAALLWLPILNTLIELDETKEFSDE